MFKLNVLLVIFILLLPVQPAFAQSESLEKLDTIADEALQLVKSDRLSETSQMLDYFSKQFLSLTAHDNILSMDELRIITAAHNDASKAVGTASLSLNEKISNVTKFRLVVDAISSKHQPMWTEMEGQIMETFKTTQQAVKTKNVEQFDESFNKLLSQYNLIHPSLKVDIAPEKIQKLDAKFDFINQYRPNLLSEKESEQELTALQSDLQSIFEEMKEDEADPSLWWVMISTGSIIIMTLSYVGWRKYKGNKESVNTRKEQND
ncbi:sporulation protein YpjB [Peribacillus deserti]|uniref:Sporulation protein YpjB n=1 Tax=Peribacillus deserti TaxID=673318 RepID=A0ABS2QIR0_9BACI|nr:sporulation protein YpjB [Peribacillus deserti]MBM7692629.1 sporulation protein YpjB [Peribacillus deserti]